MLCFNSLQTGKWIRISHQPLAVSHQQRGVSVERKPLIAEGFRKPAANSHYAIPFKRESRSKDKGSSQVTTRKIECFNSLQTGKQIQSEDGWELTRGPHQVFQFPSNGKADRKILILSAKYGLIQPEFQFPSNGKAYRKAKSMICSPAKRQWCFNSLQTGKRIASYSMRIVTQENAEFQFPSNGKADCKYATKG